MEGRHPPFVKYPVARVSQSFPTAAPLRLTPLVAYLSCALAYKVQVILQKGSLAISLITCNSPFFPKCNPPDPQQRQTLTLPPPKSEVFLFSVIAPRLRLATFKLRLVLSKTLISR